MHILESWPAYWIVDNRGLVACIASDLIGALSKFCVP